MKRIMQCAMYFADGWTIIITSGKVISRISDSQCVRFAPKSEHYNRFLALFELCCSLLCRARSLVCLKAWIYQLNMIKFFVRTYEIFRCNLFHVNAHNFSAWKFNGLCQQSSEISLTQITFSCRRVAANTERKLPRYFTQFVQIQLRSPVVRRDE